jgi:nucleoside-diphosphate-sugar epimerase
MILVTGGAGYIGSVLISRLRREGKEVRVFDKLMYTGESLLPYFNYIDFYQGDIRNQEDCIQALKGVDRVIHLAAIVGEAACAKDPELARETNLYATRQLWEIARDQGTKSFLFASTCSNYGTAEFADEKAELKPLGLYAETKVEAERWLLSQEGMDTTILRFATAFGVSPRMRWDLLINQFVLDAYLNKELSVYNPSSQRPYCHVKDISSMIMSVLWMMTTFKGFNHEIFNIGGHNRSKIELAEYIRKLIPCLEIKTVITGKGRDYRVDFSKIQSYGNFPWLYPEKGIQMLVDAIPLFDHLLDRKWVNA